MNNLLKKLDESLGKLEIAKNHAKNLCDFDTMQGVADCLSLMERISCIETQICELMREIVENEERKKLEERNRCIKCED